MFSGKMYIVFQILEIHLSHGTVKASCHNVSIVY